MARPKVPVEIKALRGTIKHSRDGVPAGAALQLSRAELPAPPDWLMDPVAIDEWHRAGSILAACGVLRDSSLSVLAHYCALHAQLVATYQRGVATDPAVLGQLRLLATSLNLVGGRLVGAPPAADNPFSKFKRHSEDDGG